MSSLTTTPLSLRLVGPVVGLNIWTFVMECWMYRTRLPAINKYMDGQVSNTTPNYRALEKLPPSVRWKADNFNHLLEQPTQFYAVMLAAALVAQHQLSAGAGRVELGQLDVRLAWGYVALRVMHSLVQSVWNHVPIRFGLFATSSIVLMALTGRTAGALWW